MLTSLIEKASRSGVQADVITITHLYVALKSRPLAILVGPKGVGKAVLVEILSQVLLDNDPTSFQKMDGHAWWANYSKNVAFFTQAQTRFNTTKLLALLAEALEPAHANHLYLACMARISPAELEGYFTTLAFQLQHGELIRLPTAHLSTPIPFPPNLLLVGTMDVDRYDWLDSALLAQTSLILWPQESTTPLSKCVNPLERHHGIDTFPRLCVRDELAARVKLKRRFRWLSQALQPVTEAVLALEKRGVSFPENVIGETIIYLANSWSEEGLGLFSSRDRNLEIALDMAVSHAILPHCLRAIRRARVPAQQVAELLHEQFPRAQTLLKQWAYPAR